MTSLGFAARDQLLVGSFDGHMRLFDIGRGKRLELLPARNSEIVWTHKVRHQIAALYDDGWLLTWDQPTLRLRSQTRLLDNVQAACGNEVRLVAIKDKACIVHTFADSGTLKIAIPDVPHVKPFRALNINSAGSLMALEGGKNEVYILDNLGSRKAKLPQGETVSDLAFGDESTLIVALNRGAKKVYRKSDKGGWLSESVGP